MLIRLKSQPDVLGTLSWEPKWNRFRISVGPHVGPLVHENFYNVECFVNGCWCKISGPKLAILKKITHEKYPN